MRVGEFARAVAVAGEDGGAVAELVLVDQPDGGIEVVDADDAEYRSEDFLAIDPHVCRDVVEQGGPDKVAILGIGA